MKTIVFCSFLFFMSCVNTMNPEQMITYKGIEKDILVLVSDSFQGRAPLTLGEEKTLAYIKQRMMDIGLEPAFKGNYLQEVPLAEITSKIPQTISVITADKRKDFEVSNHFSLWSPMLKEKIEINSSELVFAGFGIDSPENDWNDFEGIDLQNKTIVVLVNDPGFHTRNDSLFNGRAMTYYGRWPYKFDEANRKGAKACIIVHEEEAAGYPWFVVDGRANRSDYYLNNNGLRERICLVNGWITREAARDLFELCGMDYEMMKDAATKPGFKPVSMGAKYSLTIKNSWEESNSYNIGGVIHGSKRPKEVLVYTAHWDHLGIGEPVDGDSIYNGASDNAAAVAWMLSIAQAFMARPEAPERSVLFLSPTAEEAGMIGSQHYVDNPVFEHSKTVACFNSDVIMFLGRFKDVTVTGLGHSELDEMLAEEAAKQGRYVCNDPNPENGMFFRSDQLPFLKAGVPALFAKGYTHQIKLGKEETLRAVDDYWRKTYHKPSDKYMPEIHSLEGLVEDTKLFYRLGLRLANDSIFPKWSRGSEFFVER